MVLLKTTLTGIALLGLGMLLVAAIGPYVTVEVQQIQRRPVEPHAEFLVGDFIDKPYNLPASVNVIGTLSGTQAPTNETSDIRVLVFDAENYQRWSSTGQASSVYSADKQGKLNFTFKIDKEGIYHFVFDNRASLYKKYVVLTIAYDEVVTQRVPDTRVGYVGWALAVVGAVILVYGLVRKPAITWA